jgi:murein DD-endopeptidase MepM/ murein hydrolase activator NlpD
MNTRDFVRKVSLCVIILGSLLWMGACTRPTEKENEPWKAGQGFVVPTKVPSSDDNPYITAPRDSNQPIQTPTPDAPHPIPGARQNTEQYIVQSGDTLGQIANRYGVTIDAIAEASELTNINILSVGQELTIPPPDPVDTGPSFKIIPDSELVASPVTVYFDVADFAFSQGGYLIRHEEEVNEDLLTGVQIVQLIAQDFSVNPRLLLAVLEYQSGWVTNPNPRTETLKYPIGWKDPNREGLYRQLAWAANELNRGYYTWRVAGTPTWILDDGTVVPIDPTINAGTAGVQYFFTKLYGARFWEKTVAEEGFFAVYNELFGYPFDYAFEPMLPSDLVQPPLQLPFEEGKEWSFTGGPHGGWGDGSAWAALDFGPPGNEGGCLPSDDWVVAMANGLIVRAHNGAVVQDLDGDGNEQTGWTILYMHIESRDRVQPGTHLQAGTPIGHPSCEGGVSNGTHVHIARRYNGEWIAADQNIPFNMDGWISSGTGEYYQGYLAKDGITLEADQFDTPNRSIQR